MSELKIPFTVEFANTPYDCVAWSKFVLKKNINNANLKLILGSCFPAIIASLYSFVYFLNRNSQFSNKLFGAILSSILIFVMLGILAVPFYFLLRALIFYNSRKIAANTAGFLENTKIIFNEDEIFSENSKTSSTSKYSRFIGFYEGKSYLYWV